MLKLIHSLGEIPFGKLMEVYEEGNLANGRENYPHLPVNMQLLEAEQDFYAYLQIFFKQQGAFYAFWYADDVLVSALRVEPYDDGALISALETRPDCRNRGYAKRLLREVCSYLGVIPVYSHIAIDNPSSQKVHLYCGFREILPYCCYLDGRINDYCHTYCYKKYPL